MKQVFAKNFSLDTSMIFCPERINLEQIETYEKAIMRAVQKMQLLRHEGRNNPDDLEDSVLAIRMLDFLDEKYVKQLEDIAKDGIKEYDLVISFGVGGSHLGCKVLFDVFCQSMWNQKTKEERQNCPQYYFAGNTLDPVPLKELLDEITRQKDQPKPIGEELKVLCLGISKSGTTLDTLAPLFFALDFFDQKRVSHDVWVITSDKPNPLRRVAEERNWRLFNIPEGLGGRFSIFSDAGLIGAAFLGIDLHGFLAGARAMEASCQSEKWQENPALFVSVLKWLSSIRHEKWVEIFMPYRAELKSFAEWYVQLSAESLGKREDDSGHVVEYGRTPVVAIGTTDLHAQNQAHQEGRRDKLVNFITVEEDATQYRIPSTVQGLGLPFSDWEGFSLSDLLNVAQKANQEALTADDRWSLTLSVSHLSPYTVGGLMYFFILAVIYEGFLAHVNPFDQPGVEKYKQRMRMEKKRD